MDSCRLPARHQAMHKVNKEIPQSKPRLTSFISTAVNGVNAAAPLTPQQPILTAQHIVTTIIPLGPHSTHTICPSCGIEINTKTRSSPGLIAYVSGFLIAVFGCWLGCCLVSYSDETILDPLLDREVALEQFKIKMKVQGPQKKSLTLARIKRVDFLFASSRFSPAKAKTK